MHADHPLDGCVAATRLQVYGYNQPITFNNKNLVYVLCYRHATVMKSLDI